MPHESAHHQVQVRIGALGWRASDERGFTLLELLMTIAIAAILFVTSWTVLVKPTMLRAKAAKSQGNMRAIGAAVQAYVQEHGSYPFLCQDSAGNGGQQAPFWSSDTLSGQGYATGKNRLNLSPIFLDPLLPESRHQPALGDYGANQLIFKTYTPGTIENALSAAAVRRPSQTILATTAESWIGFANPPAGGSWMISKWWPTAPNAITNFVPSDRGLSGVMCLFVDGHVELVNKQDLYKTPLEYMTP